ncbi:MAG: ABC transporter ATP-binding protein [Proteobacteria bacterium]|nr:ABC transporter ATP-binding protein [Pseudomonadota bacterium]
MIRTKKLKKYYGSFEALVELDLNVASGEFYGFLGPNGAGKTTTVKILAGLLKASAGNAFVGGYDISREAIEAKKIIGFIPDRPYIYEKLTASEFLIFTARLFNMDAAETRLRIDEYLELFGLMDWKNELIESFSHGMRQKTIMAAALLHRPKIIIVDEPMVGLDPKGAKLVKKILKNLCNKGTTVFMSTHSLPVAEELCDRIGIIQKGQVIAEGTMEELRTLAKNSPHTSHEKLEDIFLNLTGEEGENALPDDL